MAQVKKEASRWEHRFISVVLNHDIKTAAFLIKLFILSTILNTEQNIPIGQMKNTKRPSFNPVIPWLQSVLRFLTRRCESPGPLLLLLKCDRNHDSFPFHYLVLHSFFSIDFSLRAYTLLLHISSCPLSPYLWSQNQTQSLKCSATTPADSVQVNHERSSPPGRGHPA